MTAAYQADLSTSDELALEGTAPLNHVQIIETVIASMDRDQKVMVGKSGNGYVWKFTYGSVEVFVQLTGETEDDTLTVWSFVLQLPAKNEAQLTRKLLEMNWTETFEARFCIVNNQIAVVSSRTLAELSPGEISRAITIVATIADNNDEALQAEFGAA
ncbi:MAG: YbjN domain-containing protein [Cyanosarcina radialis HA8281-LM2]|jgi:hypothetical protein|nr:YbjN domain-containing protein [Cyanosarcina radialis HA8281-LM2]